MASQRVALSGPTLSPPWLCGENTNGQRFMFLIGMVLDALLEKQSEGMLAKLPGQADTSAIPIQAADRVLAQGPAETDASFVERMRRALDSWAIAGSRHAVSEQIQAYLQNLQPGVAVTLPECTIVGGNTSRATWDQAFLDTEIGASPAHRLVEPSNWDWDGRDTPRRSWLVLFMHLVDTGVGGNAAAVTATGGSGVAGVTSGFATVAGLNAIGPSNVGEYITLSGSAHTTNNGTFQIVAVAATTLTIANPLAVVDAFETLAWSIGRYPYIAPAPVWGSPQFVWGQGSWGVSCSQYVVQSLRQTLSRWKSAGTYYPNIIVSFGGGDGTAGRSYSPLNTITHGAVPSENPNGDWGDIGKNIGGAWSPAKTSTNAFDAFCDGTGVAVQCYEKNYG